MSLLGFLLTLATFPGVIAHELAHEKACDWYGVPVFETCYFRIGNPAGYVRHAEPERYRQAVAVSVAPFAFNTLLAIAVFALLGLTLPGGELTEAGRVGLALFWLGGSFAIHAFPSTGDATSLWGQTKSRWRDSPLTLFGLPVIGLIYLVNLLNVLWLDVIYAVVLFLTVTSLVPAVPL